MVTSFEAPAELIEFTWEAAKAAAQVFSGVPQITPLHVLGPPCKWRIASARRLFFHLVRQHVWTPCVPNGTQGRLPIAIVFGDVELDEAAHRVRRGGEAISLSPTVFWNVWDWTIPS